MSQRIPDDVVSRVQSNVNIVDIVSQFVQLRKRGKNYFGHCPFHDERTPSFSVTEEKQIFHCFSCGRGGSVFSFISELEGLTFAESVVRVAELAQIPIDVKLAQSSRESQEQSAHRGLYQAHQKADEWYQHVLLQTRGGERALEYAQSRGYSMETIETFHMGYALADRTMVTNLVSQLGLSHEEMNETGLFVERGDDFVDRFYQRLMIPLRNPNGQVVGFSGRVLPGGDDSDIQEAKYLNSPETPLFNKRYFLFNFDLAKGEIRKKSQVVLFEGYMDVIAAYQAGVKNGVASMGTSLTAEQIQILSRVASEVVIAYDGDRPGLEATNRAVELLQQHSNLKLAILPLDEGIDPDEYIQQKGADAFVTLLNHQTESVFQFKKRFLSKTYRLELERERVQFLEQMVGELAKISKPIERELAIQSLATEFQLAPELVSSQVNSLIRQQQRPVNREPVVTGEMVMPVHESSLERTQKQLLYRLMHSKEAWSYLLSQDEDFIFPSEPYQNLYQLVSEFRRLEDGEFDRQAFLNFLREDDMTNRHLMSAIEWMDFPEECTEQEIHDLMDRLSRKNSLKQVYNQKKQAMQAAQLAGNIQEANALMLELVTIQKQLKSK